ncbi:MAG TPA: hypothetical protein DEA08_26120 [Planctomycetes bacterium]|nr:hypothetical protein [Planctomycetota bacterium]
MRRIGADPVELVAHRRLGAPVMVDNLTVWPVLTDQPLEIGEFLTLKEAQERGQAKVLEVGAEEGQDRASVGTLQVRNEGELPILIPAGTIVKGGKQDRQIGQDLVVRPKSQVPVEAFCVEAGRWTANRAGVQTKGEFKAHGMLALSSVRSSGQYAKNQGEVWAQVSRANYCMSTSPGTSTLLATLEDDDERAKSYRKAVREAVSAHFAAQAEGIGAQGWVTVGLAYAIDGAPQTVRVFAHPDLLKRQLPSYLRTISFEVDVAQRAVLLGCGRIVKEPAKAQAVLKLVREIEAAKQETAAIGTHNRNRYRRAKAGGNSRCELLHEGRWVPVSEDWTVSSAPVEGAAPAQGNDQQLQQQQGWPSYRNDVGPEREQRQERR